MRLIAMSMVAAFGLVGCGGGPTAEDVTIEYTQTTTPESQQGVVAQVVAVTTVITSVIDSALEDPRGLVVVEFSPPGVLEFVSVSVDSETIGSQIFLTLVTPNSNQPVESTIAMTVGCKTAQLGTMTIIGSVAGNLPPVDPDPRGELVESTVVTETITIDCKAPAVTGPCTPETRISLTGGAPLTVGAGAGSFLSAFNGCVTLLTEQVGAIEKIVQCVGAACSDAAVPTTAGAAFSPQISTNGHAAIFRSGFGFDNGVDGVFSIYKIDSAGAIVGPVKPMEGTERISGDGSSVVTAVADNPSLRLFNIEWHDLDAATHPSLAVSACGPIQTNANLENTGDGLMYVADASGELALISKDGGYTIVQRGDAPTDPLTACARQDFDDFPGQTPSGIVASADLTTIAGLVDDPRPEAFLGAVFVTTYTGNPFTNPTSGTTTMVSRDSSAFQTDFGVQRISASEDGRFIAYVQVGDDIGGSQFRELWVFDKSNGAISYVADTSSNTMIINPNGANIIHHDATTGEVIILANPLCVDTDDDNLCDPA